MPTTHPSRYLQRTHCQSCDRAYICLQRQNRTRGEPPCCLKLPVCSQAGCDGPTRRRFPAAGAYVFVSMGLVGVSLLPAMRISSAIVARSHTSGACSSLRGQPWLLTGPPWAECQLIPRALTQYVAAHRCACGCTGPADDSLLTTRRHGNYRNLQRHSAAAKDSNSSFPQSRRPPIPPSCSCTFQSFQPQVCVPEAAMPTPS